MPFMFGPPPSAEQQAHYEEVQRQMDALRARAADLEREHRERVLRWAPLLCTCRRRWDVLDREPAASGCVVHGIVFISEDGAVVL